MALKQSQWTRTYNEKAYDRLSVVIPKGKRELLANKLKEENKTVNGFLNEVIRQYLGIDESDWIGTREPPR